MRYPLLIPLLPPAASGGEIITLPLVPSHQWRGKTSPPRLVGGVGGGQQKRDRIFRASSRNDPPAEKLHQRHDN